MSSENPFHDVLKPISWLFGKWETIDSEVFYPGMTTTKYKDIIEIGDPSPMLPVVNYKSTTWRLDTMSPLHAEKGYFQVDPDTKKVSLNVAHFFGGNEICEGEVNGQTLKVESTHMNVVSYSKCNFMTQVIREWSLKDGVLHSDMWMATTKNPLEKHITSTLRKVA